ncbi:MAG TPA: aminotransferase class I/II-fold pyridoxal phosphate-dependent enzyme, partial [Solirubrobacterales bacterium]|nr:aminotransferase class I/II-fold pyridoxal phosphate-dependent enzyme [Solirubrobacterales bacterium]
MAASPPPRRQQTRAKDLERYASLFARRTRVMRSSAMRDMMEITARPEVISLAGGLPDTSTFPPEAFAAEMHRIEKTAVAEVLQYGPTEGSWLVREQIVEVMAAEGTRVDALDITVTTGGQQGIDLITKTLIDPGDVIICDAPTYPGAIPTFCSYEADVRQIEMDADGMRVDLLEEMIAKLEAEGRKPKFIYSIPTFQNP